MPIEFSCESCGKGFKVGDEMAGRKGKCSACGATMVIPEAYAVLRPREDRSMSPAAGPAPAAHQFGHAQHPATAVQVVLNQHGDRKSANGLGVAGVVIGVICLLVCWMPLVNIAVIPFGFVGGLLSLVGLIVALTNKRSGPGWAIAGMTLNAVAFLGMVATNVIVFGAAANVARTAAKAAEEAKAAADAEADARKKAGGEAPPPAAPPEKPAEIPAPATPPPPPTVEVGPDRTSANPVAALAARPDPAPGPAPTNIPEPPKPRTFARGMVVAIDAGTIGVAYFALNPALYSKMAAAALADRGAQIIEMADRGDIFTVDNGTCGVVMEAGDGIVRVRIAEGGHAGESGWVQSTTLIESDRTFAAPLLAKEVAKAAPAPLDAAAKARRAATIYQMGVNLRFEGKADAALEQFRRVLKEFPGTPSAKSAAEQVRALSGK